MRILAIETSCDETAISIIEATGDVSHTNITVLANIVHTQIEIHKEYGGVFPALAKREHSKNLIPVLTQALVEAQLEKVILCDDILSAEKKDRLAVLLEREPELLALFLQYIPTIDIPAIDAIVVTHGPGLEPALWVGVNFAKALTLVWDKPLIPVNHMEGHLFSGLLEEQCHNQLRLGYTDFPLLALLISGGHTELTLMKEWFNYDVIGETRDDAVGEAFDKAARMLSLPYPGGPEIARLADEFAETLDETQRTITLPRPMIGSGDLDFSFSGLKTAVLTLTKKIPEMTDKLRAEIAYEFQEAASEVLVAKTLKAIEKHGIKTLVIGGGVSANHRIRQRLAATLHDDAPDVALFLPAQQFTTDNALMIALAGYARYQTNPEAHYTADTMTEIAAHGTLRLSNELPAKK